MLNSILNFLIKKPVWSLVAFLIIICSSILQIQNFSLDASSESLSLEGDNNLELYFSTQETFGSDESLVISYSAKENTVLSKNQLISLTSLRDDLLNIDGIGKTQVSSIKSFFANDVNVKVLYELGKVLTINNTVSMEKDGLLRGKSFLVTGKLKGISRAEVKSLIEENSGTAISSVSKKLDYLIVGEKPTKRKIEAAKNLNIITLDQKQFLTLLNKTS